MGYIKNWSVEDIIKQIRQAAAECTSPYSDGFNSWEIKQDLYLIKWFIDDSLKQCPTFSLEENWLKEQEKKRLIKILKEEK